MFRLRRMLHYKEVYFEKTTARGEGWDKETEREEPDFVTECDRAGWIRFDRRGNSHLQLVNRWATKPSHFWWDQDERKEKMFENLVANAALQGSKCMNCASWFTCPLIKVKPSPLCEKWVQWCEGKSSMMSLWSRICDWNDALATFTYEHWWISWLIRKWVSIVTVDLFFPPCNFH